MVCRRIEKRILALAMIACMMVLSACSKGGVMQPGSDGLGTPNDVLDEMNKEESVSLDDPVDHEKSPFVITVTDEDKIYIEIKKEIYDPSKVDYAYFAEFSPLSS